MSEPDGIARGPTSRRGNVVGEARGLVLAALLAALAGIVDTVGYLHLGGLFISFMSGNSTQLAAALGLRNFNQAGVIAELIGLFVAGATAGEMLAAFTGRWHMTWVLGAVAGLLALTASSAMAPEPMVFAMGALNAAMHRAGSLPVSLTFVTGVLVRFGQGLGNFLMRRASGWGWLEQAVLWIGLMVGATIGSILYLRIGAAAIWVPVGMASILAAYSMAIPQPD